MPVTSRVWNQIADKLNNKLTSNSIYLTLYHDRNLWKTQLKALLGLHSSPMCEDVNFEYDESSSDSIGSHCSTTQIFEIELPYDKFRTILPRVVDYKRKETTRSYNVLKPHAWTDVINDEFLSKYKLPCNFIYKRAKVSIEPSKYTNYIKFEGKCKEENCGALQ